MERIAHIRRARIAGYSVSVFEKLGIPARTQRYSFDTLDGVSSLPTTPVWVFLHEVSRRLTELMHMLSWLHPALLELKLLSSVLHG